MQETGVFWYRGTFSGRAVVGGKEMLLVPARLFLLTVW